MKYYTMLVKEPGGEWCPEFGDFKRKVVAEQMACDKRNLGFGYGFVKGTEFKIVRTACDQNEVDAAVVKLNRKKFD